MKAKRFSGIRSLVMLFLIVISLTAFANAADTQVDQAAFGNSSISFDQKLAWTNDALSKSEMKALINQQELHPQETGWDKLDALLNNLLKPYRNKDTYTQLRAIYDYLVTEVTYSWEGYSKQTAPAYEYFTKLDYLKNMNYEEGLQKSIPDDMANRAYHVFYAKRGVCYDYAIAFAVAARYIGIDSYVHTGWFIFEDPQNGSGHHGWSLLTLNGTNYVFDPQRDARNWQYHGQNGYYFGIPLSKATRYLPDYDKTANAERDASMLSVTATRARRRTITIITNGHGTVQSPEYGIDGQVATLTAKPNEGYAFIGWYDRFGKLLSTNLTYSFPVSANVTVTAQFGSTITLKSSRSGSVLGGGTYPDGTEVTLTAQPATDREFQGWYTPSGVLLSEDSSYKVTADGAQTMIGMFQGDYFYDVTDKSWFLDAAMEAAQRGMVKGTNDITFSPNVLMTRGQLVTILARMEQADTDSAPVCPFTDVDQSRFYAPAVNWAYANKIVLGVTETTFDPNAPITRQQLVSILVRYLTEVRGLTLDSAELTFTDQNDIGNFARDAVQQAVAIGLVQGFPDGSFQPRKQLPRSEGVTVLVRLAHYLDHLPAEPEAPQPEEPTPEQPENPDNSGNGTPPEETPEVSPTVSPEPSEAPDATPEPPEISPAPVQPDSTVEDSTRNPANN